MPELAPSSAPLPPPVRTASGGEGRLTDLRTEGSFSRKRVFIPDSPVTPATETRCAQQTLKYQTQNPEHSRNL